MGQPRPLFNLFSSFQTNITILTTNKCEKCPSSIWDSNLQPSDYESPPLSTRPGLPFSCLRFPHPEKAEKIEIKQNNF